jgi:hypothetical protein
MKINIPSKEELSKKRRRKFLNFLGGSIIGVIIFGVGSSRLWFRKGFNEIEFYTWIALGFGVLSFGIIGMLFGSNFWKSIFGPFK